MEYTLITMEVRSEIALENDEYNNEILIKVQSSKELVPMFDKILTVTCHNRDTGFEVDTKRMDAINSYLSEINK